MRGAVAIEFALIFAVFVALFYAVVSYGFVFAVVQGFTYAAEDSLRAAIATDCTQLTTAECKTRITGVIRDQVADSLGWMPERIREKALGESGENVLVDCDTNYLCDVSIQYANTAQDPLVPTIELPVVGAVPKLPALLVGRARLRI